MADLAEQALINYVETKKKNKRRQGRNGKPSNGNSEFYQIKMACLSSINYLKNNLEQEVEKLVNMQQDVISNIEHLLKK